MGAVLYDTAARGLATQRLQDPNEAVAFVGCSPTLALGGNDTCMLNFVRSFGLKAWRRPLAADEEARLAAVYAAVANEQQDAMAGMKAVVCAILGSPFFVYRVEVGELQPDGTRALTGYELATRLSFLLWNTTPVDSIAVGVSTAFQGGCLSPKNNVCTPPTQASWLAGNRPNYIEFSHRSLYATLFGSTALDSQQKSMRISVLDSVLADMKSLRTRLGAVDAQRLDAHAQSVRDIETSMANVSNTCGSAQAPADIPSDPRTKEPLQERNRLFPDMIAMALSCDITRVFTVQFTGRENDTVFWQTGATLGHHDLSHLSNGAISYADGVTALGKIQAFTMGELNYLLQKLASTKEGSGNLLDSCAINITSCVGNPISHSYNNDMCQIIAGRAQGALKGGTYYKATNEFATAVPLTALRAAGVSLPSFGSVSSVGTADHGLEMISTDPIGALLT